MSTSSAKRLPFVALALLIVACDGATEVIGHVTDAHGRPLAGVNVQFEYSGRDGDSIADDVSRADGCFDAFHTHAPGKLPLVLRATKDGYKPYVAPFVSGDYLIDIRLAPKDAVWRSSGRFVSFDDLPPGRKPCQR